MRVQEFDRLMREWMIIDELTGVDSSLNGLQVAGSREEIRRVALAVDASLETFRRAAEWTADLLFVHHGLFWGREQAVTGGRYRRLRFLIESGLALYAVHLPLDMQPEFGNNAGLARRLGLRGLEPFGTYRGQRIGFKGELESALSLSEVAALLGEGDARTLGQLPFGPERSRRVGIVSGGAADEVLEAIEQGLDLYITGDASHTVYHACLEGGINVIFGGHYATEQWGVRLLGEKLARETGLETCFIDLPTGL
jgi:dinuclear metal center YbgI/SA1388 family protein